MAIPISKLDWFKLETEFGDGYHIRMGYVDKGARVIINVEADWFRRVWKRVAREEEPGGQLRATTRFLDQNQVLAGHQRNFEVSPRVSKAWAYEAHQAELFPRASVLTFQGARTIRGLYQGAALDVWYIGTPTWTLN